MCCSACVAVLVTDVQCVLCCALQGISVCCSREYTWYTPVIVMCCSACCSVGYRCCSVLQCISVCCSKDYTRYTPVIVMCCIVYCSVGCRCCSVCYSVRCDVFQCVAVKDTCGILL